MFFSKIWRYEKWWIKKCLEKLMKKMSWKIRWKIETKVKLFIVKWFIDVREAIWARKYVVGCPYAINMCLATAFDTKFETWLQQHFIRVWVNVHLTACRWSRCHACPCWSCSNLIQFWSSVRFTPNNVTARRTGILSFNTARTAFFSFSLSVPAVFFIGAPFC